MKNHVDRNQGEIVTGVWNTSIDGLLFILGYLGILFATKFHVKFKILGSMVHLFNMIVKCILCYSRTIFAAISTSEITEGNVTACVIKVTKLSLPFFLSLPTVKACNVVSVPTDILNSDKFVTCSLSLFNKIQSRGFISSIDFCCRSKIAVLKLGMFRLF